MTLTTLINLAGGIVLCASALSALLTTPRRAEQVRQRRTIADLQERVDALEDQLRDERTRRLTAETAATAARDRAAHVEAFAVGEAALAEFIARLDRLAA